MSTLEKTIELLNSLQENQIEAVYSFARFLSLHQTEAKLLETEDLENIFENIVGVVPDTGRMQKRKDFTIM